MPTVKRPLSPHLQVYRPQITSLLSILHRITGLALSLGTLMLIWQLLAAASGPHAYENFRGFAGSWFGILVLLGWSLSLFYHLLNGVRHLVWDAGYGYELEDAYRSGRFVLIGTAALTLLAWIVALIVWGHH